MKPGIYNDLSNDDYHAAPGISKSGLDALAACPALYKARYIDRTAVKSDTPAMADGRALHVAVLEPEKFVEQYATCPKCDKRTKAGKELWEQFCADNAGKLIISVDDYDRYMRIRDAVLAETRAAAVLADGQAETSMFHIDEPTGELIKCRPDWFIEDVLVDLKFMQSAAHDAFVRECYQRRYFVQAAYYQYIAGAELGRQFNSFIFIVVEKEAPYLIGIYEADQDMIMAGTAEYRMQLERIAECRASGLWPGYNEGNIVPVSLPKWAKTTSMFTF